MNMCISTTLAHFKHMNIKPNFSELARQLGIDRHTLKKHFDAGGVKPRKKRECISDFGLEVLMLIKEFPGIKVPEIVKEFQMKDLIGNSDKVRNEIKRNLYNYIEYKGSYKMGGYYLK